MGERKKGTPPNGGYGWVVVLAACGTRLFLYGITMTTGVMYDVFLKEFGEGKGDTAWISSLITAVGFLACPVSGVLTDIVGPRPVVIGAGLLASLGLCLSTVAPNIEFLIVTYGIITGIGYGSLYVPISVAVASYFTTKRNIAMGIAAAGGGCGSLIFPPILRVLVTYYDWSGCLLICGGLSLNVCACGILFRPMEDPEKPKKEIKIKDTEEKIPLGKRLCKALHGKVFRNPGYMILWLNNVMFTFGMSVVYVHLATFAQINVGLDVDTSAMLFSIIGGSLIVSKLGQGFLAHRISVYLLYIIAFTVAGIGTMLVPFIDSFGLMVVYSVVFGFGVAGHGGALIPGIIVDMLGMERLPLAYGALFLPAGIGQMFGGPVAGWLFDASKSYDVSFYTAGALMAGSGLVMIIPWKCFGHVSNKDEMAEINNLPSLIDMRELGSALSLNMLHSNQSIMTVAKKPTSPLTVEDKRVRNGSALSVSMLHSNLSLVSAYKKDDEQVDSLLSNV